MIYCRLFVVSPLTEKKYAGPERFLSLGLANVLDVFTVYNYPSHPPPKNPIYLAPRCPRFENGRIFISLRVFRAGEKGISPGIVLFSRGVATRRAGLLIARVLHQQAIHGGWPLRAPLLAGCHETG